MSQNFGPDNGSLKIRTGRTGGAAKAGHDLVIEVESWQATLDPEGQPALTLPPTRVRCACSTAAAASSP